MPFRATELSRVANAAIRSAPSFRSSTLRIQSGCLRPFTSTTCNAQWTAASIASSPRVPNLHGLPSQQKRHESAWATPNRVSREPLSRNDENISKPTDPTSSTSSTTPDRSLLFPPRGPSDLGYGDRNNLFRNNSSYDRFGAFDSDADLGYTDEYEKRKSNQIDTNLDPNILKRDENKIPKEEVEIRCVPRTGRTVHIGKNADVARAFKSLEMQCNQNRVRADLHAQRFHERPGLKRKRLKSQRWQRRFKKGFKAACSRVNEMRRQGW